MKMIRLEDDEKTFEVHREEALTTFQLHIESNKRHSGATLEIYETGGDEPKILAIYPAWRARKGINFHAQGDLLFRLTMVDPLEELPEMSFT